MVGLLVLEGLIWADGGVLSFPAVGPFVKVTPSLSYLVVGLCVALCLVRTPVRVSIPAARARSPAVRMVAVSLPVLDKTLSDGSGSLAGLSGFLLGLVGFWLAVLVQWAVRVRSLVTGWLKS